ncbi:MAG: hypothetical protein RLZZ245_2302 [Verrucomicrobiota bacterium]
MIEVPPARIPEEPAAVIPHAGFCEGGRRKTDVSYFNLLKMNITRRRICLAIAVVLLVWAIYGRVSYYPQVNVDWRTTADINRGRGFYVAVGRLWGKQDLFLEPLQRNGCRYSWWYPTSSLRTPTRLRADAAATQMSVSIFRTGGSKFQSMQMSHPFLPQINQIDRMCLSFMQTTPSNSLILR